MSLSNTLFRRDAGAFAAYLVDAETGKLYDGGLSNGQRENDLEIGRVNIAGELLDLQAGGRLDEDVDPVAVADGIVSAYRSLWTELTVAESFPQAERWRINQRVERLNDLGFDIGELSIGQDETGTQVRIQPKVVDAGHHSRRLLRLTGLDAGENQARRLLNDLDAYRATGDRKDLDEEMVAHDWLVRVFEPVIRSIPKDLKGKLEPAEVFHQLLDHRWYLSQNEKRNVPLAEALTSYIDDVLRHRRDEVTVVGPPTGVDHGRHRRRRRRRGLAVEGLTVVRPRRPDAARAARRDRWRRGPPPLDHPRRLGPAHRWRRRHRRRRRRRRVALRPAQERGAQREGRELARRRRARGRRRGALVADSARRRNRASTTRMLSRPSPTWSPASTTCRTRRS